MSKVLPIAIHDRPELNLRQGIKSSLNHWRQLIASLYLFYQYLLDGGDAIYSKEIHAGGKVCLGVSDGFASWLSQNWSQVANVKSLVQQCPLYTAQMEHLQVGLQLFLKLAQVKFADNSLPDATERTGGNRFNKLLRFSTNMKILADAISTHSVSERITFVADWLSGNDDANVSKGTKEILAAFTEECQFKIRTASGEVFFQQDGIYDCLRNVQDSVESTDAKEPVGPFRILKTYINEEMHPYLSEGASGFVVKSSSAEFAKYADMVRTTLSLIPRRTTIYQEVAPTKQMQPPINSDIPLQRICYGAPGTGKSHDTDDLVKKYNVANFRTTFHPDSDYASFVGAYKPTMNAGNIVYSFRPQAFMNAYAKAWKLMANPSEDGKTEKVVLVIEEINRGNCAQIFGDLFQLLDRDGQSGYSTYPIDADVDLAVWLGGQFGYAEGDENKNGLNVESRPSCLTQSDWNDVLKGKKLALPPNLYIWATMNTSDQSLFPIDSAFKRRWDWQYVPISRPVKDDDLNWKDRKINANGKLYDWWDFIRIVNAHIADVTKSEDKQLGYFFVKAPDDTGVITAERFANKVLFYLFNDVFKDWDLPVAIFEKDSNSKKKFAFKDFFYDVPDANHVVGSVREDVVAAFIEKQEYEGEKVKADAPPSNGGETPDTPDPEVAPPPAQF